MPASEVLIEISPSEVTLTALSRGAPASSRSFEHNIGALDDDTAAKLPLIAPDLRRLVSELHLEAARATVLISNSECASHVFSTSFSGAAAQQAAELSITGLSGATSASHPVAAKRLTFSGRGVNQQEHWNVATAPGDLVQAIDALVRSLGLRFSGCAPVSAWLTLKAADWISEHARGETTTVVLLVGADASVIAAGSSGTLRFVRTATLGTESLVDAVRRAVTGGDGGECLRGEARAMLMRAGIPDRDAVVDRARGITGAKLLPALQPPIQRLAVELKQSLRFGLEGAEREAARVVLLMPQGRIPGLATALTALAKSAITESTAESSGRLAEDVRRLPVLCTAEFAASMRVRRARMALRLGAVCAMTILAADYAFTQSRIGLARRVSDMDAGRLIALRESHSVLTRAKDELAAFRAGAAHASGAGSVWGPAMMEIAALVPDGIRLTEVRSSDSQGKPSLTLAGIAGDADDDLSVRALREFTSMLDRLPIFGSVDLTKTQRLAVDGGTRQTFEMSVVLVRPPRVEMSSRIGSAREIAAP